jgi:hypothetical protein
MCIKINKIGKQEVGIWWVQKRFPRYGVSIWSLWPNIRFLPSIVAEKNVTKNVHICSMCIKTNLVGKQEVGIRRVQKRYPQYGIPIWRVWPNIRFLPSTVTEKNILDRGKTVYPPPLSGSGRFKTSTHAQQSLGCLLETSEYLIAVHVSREKATNTFRISLVEENGSYCFKGLSWIFSDSTWPSTWFEFCSNNMAAFCVDEISDIFWLKQTLHK